MKPENKLPVLDLISAEMKTVVNTLQPDLPSWPATGTIAEQRQYYTLERRFWNAGAPEMATRAYMVPTKYGQVETRLFCPQPDSPATLFYLHGGGFILGNLDTHDRIMRLLASYSQCTVIGIDYTLSPEARFPQAIEEIVAACCYFHQQAEDYQINMSRIGFAGDSAGAMLALASALWLRDKQIDCGKIAGVLLWYGLYGLRDSVTRRLLGGVWDGLTQQDLQMYEEAYLSNDADRESPYYCLFNNDLTREVPPCFIAGAEFDPLLDDSRLLYQTLAAHQQPCEFKLYPGTLHAFLHYSRMMKTADEALRDGAQFFTAQLLPLVREALQNAGPAHQGADEFSICVRVHNHTSNSIITRLLSRFFKILMGVDKAAARTNTYWRDFLQPGGNLQHNACP